MADDGHTNEDDGSLEKLVKDLAGSTEMMNSLTQVLIPGLVEQLKSGDAMNELLQRRQTPARRVTSRENSVSSNLTPIVTTPTFSGTGINPGNAAGNNNSNAAVWSNAAHQGNAAQFFPWPQNAPSQFYPMYPPMYPCFHSTMGMPQSSSDGAGPSSLCSGAPSSVSALSNSDTDINPFIGDDERDELLGDILSEEEEQEDDQEEEEEDGPPPTKRAKFMPSDRTMKILKAVTEKPIKNEKRKSITNKYPLPSCDYAHTPKLDDDIACIVPKSAKTYD